MMQCQFVILIAILAVCSAAGRDDDNEDDSMTRSHTFIPRVITRRMSTSFEPRLVSE